MFPLVLTLVLALFSFLASAFVILRIVLPVLPPSPFSRRVAPAEFGLPNFKELSTADKAHLWLATLDIAALAMLVWEVLMQSMGSATGFAMAQDAGSSVRIWLAMTVRQGCLLAILGLTLLHVRRGQSTSLGRSHWLILAPVAILTITSSAVAGVLAGAGVNTLFTGLAGYTSAVALLSSTLFISLAVTLFKIQRNLNAVPEEEEDNWPPVRRVEEDKPRPSFTTDEVDALRDGASWITSTAGSRRGSISAWSFSTHHTSHQEHHGGRPQNGNYPSVPAKNSFWFGNPSGDLEVPPVPPLPVHYGPFSPSAVDLRDEDPFRRTCPSPLPDIPDHPINPLGSQTSWLTSTNGSHTTMSAWSFPTTVGGRAPGSSTSSATSTASAPQLNAQLLPSSVPTRPTTPALSNAQVLGGYGYTGDAEKGLQAGHNHGEVPISNARVVAWMVLMWLPIALALPLLCSMGPGQDPSSTMSLLLVLSVVLSSPMLTIMILCGWGLPIPTADLFVTNLPTNIRVGGSSSNTLLNRFSHEYKRSCSASVTVVEGRRSGDVWIEKKQAVDGKDKVGRAVEMMLPRPKLSVMPVKESDHLMPPTPFRADDAATLSSGGSPASALTAEFGRLRKDSKASSRLSGSSAHQEYTTRIMVAQRHYSALAKTIEIQASPEKRPSAETMVDAEATGAQKKRTSVMGAGHLRNRSVPSIYGPETPTGGSFRGLNPSPTPPPAFPLPPTPPSVRTARLAQLGHKKSFSSGFDFGPINDMNEIDALTAGVLPILVPGLKVGEDMRIKQGKYTPPESMSRRTVKMVKKASPGVDEFGNDWSSPQFHSTPARRPREARSRKSSHRSHYSLPSLGLGMDGVHSLQRWSAEIAHDIENKVRMLTAAPDVELGRRATVFGGETVPNMIPNMRVADKAEQRAPTTKLSRQASIRSLGLRPEVPHTARSSLISIPDPLSAASTATLFELDPPQAESTPHNTAVSRRRISQDHAPPMPNIPQHVMDDNRTARRRSSIVYIRSDDVPMPIEAPTTTSTRPRKPSLVQRAVRPLIPKKSAKLRKSDQENDTTSSPRGLRPLSLLSTRDVNAPVAAAQDAATKPLSVGKKQKERASRRAVVDAENVDPTQAAPASTGGKKRGLRPLQLGRSDTSKMRAILQRDEGVPNVVVRPPSGVESYSTYRAYAA
ncbi:hypothetical protein EV715DRAFT_248647 [Schizophyllum commune]